MRRVLRQADGESKPPLARPTQEIPAEERATPWCLLYGRGSSCLSSLPHEGDAVMSTPTAGNTHHRTCNLCEAMCGISIEVSGGKVASIRGDKSDPFSRGYICPKAAALADLHEDPDRLRHPVRRTASGFVRIGWDEAFDEVASRLRAVQAEHGRNALGLYLGNPNVHNYGSLLFGLPF